MHFCQGMDCKHTVGTYSLGNLLVVYDINKQVWEKTGTDRSTLTAVTISTKRSTHLANRTITHYDALDCLHVE